MWYYCIMTGTHKLTRRILEWQIDQARELGLHNEQAAMAQTFAPGDRAELMYSQILYAHLVTCGTEDQAPLIRPGEFDSIFLQDDARPPADAAIATSHLAVELALLNTQVLLNLHDTKLASMSTLWLLRVEERWGYWRDSWNASGQTTGWKLADSFLCISWDW